MSTIDEVVAAAEVDIELGEEETRLGNERIKVSLYPFPEIRRRKGDLFQPDNTCFETV